MVKAVKNETDAQKVVRLRGEGLGWAEVAEKMGIGAGKCQVLYFSETLSPEDKVSFKDDDDAAKKIVKLRDKDNVAWGIIGVRMGISESKVRRLYEQATGNSTKGLRIGKGGRYPSENGAAPAKKAAAKKAAAPAKKAGVAKKAAATKKASPAKASGPVAKKALASMTLPELQGRLNGRKITVASDDGEEQVQVKVVRSLKAGQMVVTDSNGKSRTIEVASVTKATK